MRLAWSAGARSADNPVGCANLKPPFPTLGKRGLFIVASFALQAVGKMIFSGRSRWFIEHRFTPSRAEKQKNRLSAVLACQSCFSKTQAGRGDMIRTCDFYVPNVALYQAELHPVSNEVRHCKQAPENGKRYFFQWAKNSMFPFGPLIGDVASPSHSRPNS